MDQDFQPTRRMVLAGLAGTAAVPALGRPAMAQDAEPPRAIRQRERHLLNDDWSFVRGDLKSAADADANGTDWSAVTLPHTWNAKDSIDDEPGYYRGPGWYRRELRVDDRWRDKRVFLYFEGANQVADVFVDGAPVGRHVGGYVAFCADVTDQLRRVKPGGAATIAVRVDNAYNPDIPPLWADFTFYGGIYRNVWLVVTDPVHIDLLDHGSSGIYVDTPDVSAASADVRVRGRVVNADPETTWVDVVSTVVDARDREVTSRRTRLKLGRGETGDFDLSLPAIRRPRLWSPESPYLYKVITVVDGGRGGRDRVDAPLGLRWYSVDAATGFHLNGSSYPLRGVNRHQDIVGKGNALSDAEHLRDLEIIKSMGANVLRLAHYPQAPAVLEAADRLGVILWEEVPLVSTVTVSDQFAANSVNMQVETVRQHYNHPSIVFRGYMNEILLLPPQPEPAGYERFVVDLARRLEETTRAEDPRRLTVMAVDRNDRYNTSGIADVPMILGWNLYHGWYYDTPDGFAQYLDKEHADHPNRPLWVSEYGADSDSRLHRVDAGYLPVDPATGGVSYQDQSIEFQQLFHEVYIRAIDKRPFLVGTTLWAQFEFGSEFRSGSVPHVNQKGLVHPDRSPKDVFYLYQALWRDKPVLHIAGHEWTHRAGTAPDAPWGAGRRPVPQPVKVYSNLDSVELFINGRSLGRRQPDDVRAATWQVPFVDGANEIVARGVARGKVITDSVRVSFTYQAPRLSDPSVPFRRLAVSAGAIVQYTDPQSLVWAEDRAYTDGGWGAIGGTTGLMRTWVNRSSEDPLYQTFREGMTAYRFDVPAGRYGVRLRFAEPSENARGKRVFSVRLNEQVLVNDLDLVAVAGPRTAHDLEGTVAVTNADGLKVVFNPTVGHAVVSGIDVTRL
ncbi:glycoside hydrolase family 2 TIM barrel-domain containing protein [Actinoallomurus sp. CA-150999]|uniref:glycoside hydrolase family 2 TIM barrel-domain containing protein n=1 Tax=Actinoallomurus sp. CA-150999 TaxID=3239887 RepID=UPI003D935D18